jgi:hypothetical protein
MERRAWSSVYKEAFTLIDLGIAFGGGVTWTGRPDGTKD